MRVSGEPLALSCLSDSPETPRGPFCVPDAVGRGVYPGVMASVPASPEPPSEPPELRNVLLTDALQTQDVAAVAFALRHGPTVVPIVRDDDGEGDPDGAIWTYRDPATAQNVLLLFSDAAHRPETLPVGLALLSPGALRTFLAVQGDEISTVFFDVAGPHPMQASPTDIIAALDA